MPTEVFNNEILYNSHNSIPNLVVLYYFAERTILLIHSSVPFHHSIPAFHSTDQFQMPFVDWLDWI